jgi:hypothetical protein
MSRHQLYVLAKAGQGQDEEYEAWYDKRHIPDMLKVPGIVGARRLPVRKVITRLEAVPVWSALAVYDIETENLDQVFAEIRSRVGTDAMLLSDAGDRTATIQLIVDLPPST